MYEYHYLLHKELCSIIKSRETLCLLKLPQFSRIPQQCTTFDVLTVITQRIYNCHYAGNQ